MITLILAGNINEAILIGREKGLHEREARQAYVQDGRRLDGIRDATVYIGDWARHPSYLRLRREMEYAKERAKARGANWTIEHVTV